MMQSDFEIQCFLPYLLAQAAEVSSLTFQQVYKNRYGILRTEWRVLFHLGLYGEMSASEIGQRAKIHKTKISRAVQRLTERRFVERALDNADRRVTRLTLTKQGRAAYDDLHSVAERYETSLLKQLDPDEAALLRRALVKLGGTTPVDFT